MEDLDDGENKKSNIVKTESKASVDEQFDDTHDANGDEVI